MTRPSSQLDKKMLKAGRKIIAKEGSAKLSIPRICSLAKANLGMFNYHFGTKENYIHLLYKGFKEEVSEFLGLETLDKSPLDKIKHAILKIGAYANENNKLVSSMFFDGLVNCSKYGDFVEKGIIPRFDHIIVLIEEAQKLKQIRDDIPTAEVFGRLVFGVVAPEIFKKYLIDTERIYSFGGASMENYTIEQRLDDAIHSLQPRGCKES